VEAVADKIAVLDSVLIIDDDEDLRASVSDVLAAAGVTRRVLASSLAELQQQAAVALSCGLAILDVNLGEGQPTGVDVSSWLRQHGFAGAIVFLTGHAATDPRVIAAAAVPNTRIVAKPFSFAGLVALARVSP
jgi:two-component system nitrogen regulation response regulator NtrX